MALWQRFVRACTPLKQITLVDIPTDRPGAAALDDRAKAAREQLGRAWLCHPANWITSPAQRERQQRTAQAVHRLTRSNNVRSFTRKKA